MFSWQNQINLCYTINSVVNRTFCQCLVSSVSPQRMSEFRKFCSTFFCCFFCQFLLVCSCWPHDHNLFTCSVVPQPQYFLYVLEDKYLMSVSKYSHVGALFKAERERHRKLNSRFFKQHPDMLWLIPGGGRHHSISKTVGIQKPIIIAD